MTNAPAPEPLEFADYRLRAPGAGSLHPRRKQRPALGPAFSMTCPPEALRPLARGFFRGQKPTVCGQSGTGKGIGVC